MRQPVGSFAQDIRLGPPILRMALARITEPGPFRGTSQGANRGRHSSLVDKCAVFHRANEVI